MNEELLNSLNVMKNIVTALRESEINNAHLARELHFTEMKKAADLNQNIGNILEMAEKAHQAALVLNNIAVAEQNAVEKLSMLEQMLTDLETKHSLL